MDTGIMLTREICKLIKNFMETINGKQNDQLIKKRVREMLNYDHGSVFCHTKTKTGSSSLAYSSRVDEEQSLLLYAIFNTGQTVTQDSSQKM